jgi:hypothetical protein
LKENRPVFVDYFLRHRHNPLQTNDWTKYSKENSKSKNQELQRFDRTEIAFEEPVISDESLEKVLIEEDQVCAGYALKFILKGLYVNNKDAPCEVRYVLFCDVFSIVFLVFLGMYYSGYTNWTR